MIGWEGKLYLAESVFLNGSYIRRLLDDVVFFDGGEKGGQVGKWFKFD